MSRSIVVCLDALRPDAIVPEMMPNLHRFRQQSLTFTKHRAIFPSDTRPNAAALVTGSSCGLHGINGNAFIVGSGPQSILIDTGSAQAIENIDRALPDGLYLAPTLGKVLAEHGKTLAVVSSASSGTTRLLHHDRALDHICLYAHDERVSLPAEFGRAMSGRFGAPPNVETPDLHAVTYSLDVFLDHIWPTTMPDVTLFWFNEPDIIYHAYGPFASETVLALYELDAQVGRLIDWWESEGVAAGAQISIISDHGQIATAEAVDVIGQMRAAGFDAGRAQADVASIKIVPGGFVQIFDWAGDRENDILAWLQEQPWCGLTFVRSKNEKGLKTAFPMSAGLYENARSANVAFTFRDRSGNDGDVVPYFRGAGSYRGMHGGLNPGETNAVCMIGGAGIVERGGVCEVPSNTSDLMPTLLAHLGICSPAHIDGRVLIDQATGLAIEPNWTSESMVAGDDRYRQILHRSMVDGHTYIDFGTVE